MRPLANMLRWDNNIPSPFVNLPIDDGTQVEEPGSDCRPNHRTGSLIIPVEATSTTPEPDGSISHRQQTTNPVPHPSPSLRTHSPSPQGLCHQQTISSLDGSAGRSSGSSSGSNLTYDSFWSSHSSSSLSYRSRASESSSTSFKQPSYTNVQKSNPIIPTLSFPTSPPSSNSLHTAMGSFHHADLALAGQENVLFLPPQP
jgi:hypothetical protein